MQIGDTDWADWFILGHNHRISQVDVLGVWEVYFNPLPGSRGSCIANYKKPKENVKL